MNKKYLLIGAASVLISFIAGAGSHYFYMTSCLPRDRESMRDAPFGPHKPEKEKFIKMLTDKLKLTSEQSDRFKKTFQDNEKKLDEFREKTFKLFGSLESLMMNKEFDESAARRILAEIDSVKMEERLLFMKSRFEAKKFLTPEQSAKLDEIMKSKFSRFRNHFKGMDKNPHD